MIYREYLVEVNNLERKLGLIGEIHSYNERESHFLKKTLLDYDLVGYESYGTKASLFTDIIRLLYTPFFSAYESSTKRNSTFDVVNYVKNIRKPLICIEKDFDSNFSFKQKLALFYLASMSIFFGLGYYFFKACKKNDKASEILMGDYLGRKKCEDYALHETSLELRDKNMAENIIEILNLEEGNLLVIFGQDHMNGIVSNLESKLDLDLKTEILI